MKSPLVTIIIPTYNQADYLGDAVRSALRQDYANLEIIIADDCSSDNTPEIAKKYAGDERLKYYRNETNLGKTANYRRTLYEFAGGEWILNLDGDDYLTDDNYISFAVEQIGRYQNVVLFTAGVKSVLEKRCRLPHTHRLVKKQTYMEGINLFLNWQRYKIPHLTSLYHRPTACRIGFYDVDISSTDWESFLRLVLHGNVILSEKIAGVWRKHENNLSRAMDFRQFAANFAFITKPMEYALSKGYDNAMLKSWEKTMTESIMRGQFNEVWINVMRKRSLAEMIQFIQTVKKEKPEFVNNFFQLKNIARFFLYFLLTVAWRMGR
ncbi:glycosyltransferase pgli [hydrocarbon metagenome]|uniref:Glycosyltransferase pgli n=1 Tax=hydrocarbon metagenome TaxID=938273 RepID=A0A0W8FLK2_9ZZZZ